MPRTTTISAPGQRGRNRPNSTRTANAAPPKTSVAGFASPMLRTMSMVERTALSYWLDRPVNFSI